MKLYHYSSEPISGFLVPKKGARRHDFDDLGVTTQAAIWLTDDQKSILFDKGVVRNFQYIIEIPDADPNLIVDENYDDFNTKFERTFGCKKGQKWFSYTSELRIAKACEWDGDKFIAIDLDYLEAKPGSISRIFRFIVKMLVNIIWAIIGLIIWIPMLFRVIALFTSVLISSQFTGSDVRSAQSKLDYAITFYMLGFTKISKSFLRSEKSAAIISNTSMDVEKILKAMALDSIWLVIFWWSTFSLIYSMLHKVG